MSLHIQRSRAIPCLPSTFGILLAVFACFYAIELTSLSLSIDDEVSAFRRDPKIWLTQGRWTIYLFELLIMPKPVLPFVPIAVFGVLISFSYVILLITLRRDPNAPAAILAFPMFAAFPVWAFITEFQANTPAAGIGVLACCAALLLLSSSLLTEQKSKSYIVLLANALLASVLIAIAAAAYQTLVLVFVSLGLAVIILNAINDSNASVHGCLRGIAILAAVSSIGVCFYSAITAALLILMNIELKHVNQLISLPVLLTNPLDVLSRTIRSAWLVYSGSETIYLVTAWSFGLVVLLSFIGIACAPALRENPRLRGLLIVLHAALLFVPFAMYPIARGSMPMRSLVAVPAVMWSSAYIAVTTPVLWLRRVSLVVVAVAIFQALYAVYLYQTNSILVRYRDSATAGAIYQKIAELQPEWDRSRTYPIVVYGAWRFISPLERVMTSTAGASFFEWDGGNSSRIAAFMRLQGYANVTAAPRSKKDKFLSIARQMPVWPAEGSVRNEGDVTIIKLGPIK